MSISERRPVEVNEILICENINKIKKRVADLKDKHILQHIFSLIDLTSLETNDTEEKIKILTEKVNIVPSRFPYLKNVAAICVYPSLISVVKKHLKDKNVKIAVAAAGFPSSQTFSEIKFREVEQAIQEGADEVDIVISMGKFLGGDYKYVRQEVSNIKKICGDKPLKVILETGEMPDLKLVKLASFLVMESGADFIKSSSGKTPVGATPEAIYVMCTAIKEFNISTGRAVGIKPSGGISDASIAVLYYLIISEILGNDWLNSKRFRFGASKLANNLLGEKYFG